MKIIKSLGSIALIGGPLMSVVSCGSNSNSNVDITYEENLLDELNEELKNNNLTMDTIIKTMDRGFEVDKIYKSKFGEFKANDKYSKEAIKFLDMSSISSLLKGESDKFDDYIYAPFYWPGALGAAAKNIKDFNYAKAYGSLSKYRNLNIAFITAADNDSVLVPSIGGSPLDGEYSTSPGLKNIVESINAIRKNDGHAIMSLGGASGGSIWKYRDPLLAARSLIDIVRYFKIHRIDFDIEEDSLHNYVSKEFALAVAIAQKYFESKNYILDISLTIPGSGKGFSSTEGWDGQGVIRNFLKEGVKIRYINAMNMGIGTTKEKQQVDKQLETAEIEIKQIQDIYAEMGRTLSKTQAAFLLGVTINVSVGLNKTKVKYEKLKNEEEVKRLYEGFLEKKIGMFSFWTLNMDEENIPDTGEGMKVGERWMEYGWIFKYFKNYHNDIKKPNDINDEFKRGIGIESNYTNSHIIDSLNSLYKTLGKNTINQIEKLEKDPDIIE